MSKHIIDANLELQYAQSMAFLNRLYHTYASRLPGISLDEAELAELAAAESLARDTASHTRIEPGIPLGRLVI